MDERVAGGAAGTGRAACVRVDFGVLGPVAAWDEQGRPVPLRGPRHRAVLARLVVARRRVVPVARLVADLWQEEPEGDAVSAVRTFVAGLRRALEPERLPRAPARLLVTEGPGYALRAPRGSVDAWRFEEAVESAALLPPARAVPLLARALESWRGPAYADFAGEPWTDAERARLAELRLHAVERHAAARIARGRPAEAVADLDAHVARHPWREEGWHLLASALYGSGRQADALSVLRRARGMLRERLGVDPGPRLQRLEEDVLRQAEHLSAGGEGGSAQVWARAAAAWRGAAPAGSRRQLETSAGLLRDLAVTGGGGLEAARLNRVAAVAAAEQLGDPELTARVIGVYDVPALWTRSDDPAQAAWLTGAAERTLRALPGEGHEAARARLLATVAIESRGTSHGPPRAAVRSRGPRAAREAEEIARRRQDRALLLFALNGVFLQTFHRSGLAARRDAIGAEILAVSARAGLETYEVLGRLVRLQARCALGDFEAADTHARAADELAARHELPLVTPFTAWYGALRTAWSEAPAPVALAAYEEAAGLLEGAGMPGLERGLLPLALLSVRLRHQLPLRPLEDADWGPYEPWARPLLLLAGDRPGRAREALRTAPDPPRDHLQEAMWCLTGRAARALGEEGLVERARAELAPAAGELAGAGSGLLSLGPVARWLEELDGRGEGPVAGADS
ncbi:BTAD domain-containing putative transcriptional regulator [Streptomyces sp. NPDC007088]|uniref:BTAD domain-containing putative transcriptional regulator n=1 Tax=Streptomyces sp. NPDC007088 TaxID=3364773 RepID=UPI0036CD9D8A